MTQFNDTGYRTITLTGTVGIYERVNHSGAQAGLERAAGTARQAGVSGDPIAIATGNKEGSRKMIADGVIAAGANVYGAASGRVSATQGSGSFFEGIALQAAASAGDVIEVECATGETAGA